MDSIAGLMSQLAKSEGVSETALQGIRIYKTSRHMPRQPLCYGQGIIIVGQGRKKVFLGDQTLEYNQDNYLVLTVPIPAECETNATEDEPLLSLIIDIDTWILNRIIGEMDSDTNPDMLKQTGKHQGLFLAGATPEIKDVVLRLLRVLQSPVESKILGQGIIDELFFRIMCGENAASLYALALKNTNLSRIDKALKLIHDNYQDPMDVEKLAGLVNMSQSAFHRAFKDVTASSPIQYLKKVRLNMAKSLLTDKGIRVNEAATEVGYESPTQFSREFKRYFGNSPVECIKTDTFMQTTI